MPEESTLFVAILFVLFVLFFVYHDGFKSGARRCQIILQFVKEAVGLVQ